MKDLSAPTGGSLLRAILVAGWCLFGPLLLARAQSGSSGAEGVTDINARPLVSIAFEVHASNQPLVIPYRRRSVDTGEYSLDNAAAYLEEKDGAVWKRVMVAKGLLAVMGVRDKTEWETVTVAPSETKTFEFTIYRELFRIPRGKRLRVKVRAWRSRESMMQPGDDPDVTLASPEFDCP